MDKRVYSAISTGLFPYNVNGVFVRYDLSQYQKLLYEPFYLDGIVSFTIKHRTIMLNLNLSGKTYEFIMDSYSYYDYKNIPVKKQYILNRFEYRDGYLYSYNHNIPKLKVKIKMYNDFRLPSESTLELEKIEYIGSYLSNYGTREMSHTLNYDEQDTYKNNRSKYCLLSALQRLAVYKSLYCILPDIFLLDRAFKMFCKRQHGINHNSFLKAHTN